MDGTLAAALVVPAMAILGIAVWPTVKASGGFQRYEADRRAKAEIATAKRAADAAIRQAETQRLAQELETVRTGNLIPIDEPRIVLHKGEQAFASTWAELIETKVIGYKAGTRGVSVRVMKGVTLRSSGTRGHAERGAVVAAKGVLAVTNQRVVFAGDKKSVSMTHKSITAFEALADGVRISDARKTVNLAMGRGHNQDLFKIAAQRLIEEGAAR